MKGFIAIWIIAAGAGVSYSILRERRHMLQCLKEVEQSLKRLAYYMCKWRMPIGEALGQAVREENSWLQEFYQQIIHRLEKSETEDFGVLWQEESRRTVLPEKIQVLWGDAFLQIPMEPEALQSRLNERAEEITLYTEELKEKYKGEQRLVMTMGFFTGAFLCLILW